MYLIIGLGNPGEQYEKTRHNVGFLVVDVLAKQWQCDEWSFDKKSSSLLADCVKPGFTQPGVTQPVLLAKPQTFMNNSGKAVKSLIAKLGLAKAGLAKAKPSLVVIHDDIDLPLGTVKVSSNRGSAGHKGVESIIQTLGSKNFVRIRVGIQPEKGKPEDVEDFVLQSFKKIELPSLRSAIQQATETLASITFTL